MSIEITADKLAEKIKTASQKADIFIIAIDGRCASGKTTLAQALSRRLCCSTVHTDDFYLQPFQRTSERYAEPGGNLDRERLMIEVLEPLRMGFRATYRPFDCKTLSFGDKITLNGKGIYIVEGSYSCHSELRKYYDMTVFMTTDRETQLERIRKRNGEERLPDFISKWIPLEEKYFEAFDVENKADAVIQNI